MLYLNAPAVQKVADKIFIEPIQNVVFKLVLTMSDLLDLKN